MSFNSSFQPNDVTPSCGGIFGFEVVFDGVCEYFGAAFAVGTGVLLGADDDGFGAVTLLICLLQR